MTDSTDDVRPGAVPSPPGAPNQPGAPNESTIVPARGVEYLDSAQPDAVAGEPSRRGRRRGLLTAAVLAVALIGGGVAYGVGQLSGGGARPDEAVPSTALAIVSIDLDPSAGQKVDALRFVRKFPGLKQRIGSGDDLRTMLFDLVRDSTELKASWDDVEPWLADRAAIAVLPAADELDGPVPVVVLAVTDEAKARRSLSDLVPDASCEVTKGFALCAEDAEVARDAVSAAAAKSLADDTAYAGDIEALGDRGILSVWLDLKRVKDAAPDLLSGLSGLRGLGSLGGMAGLAGVAPELGGRYVAAVRFDGPNLEVAGRVEGAGVPELGGTADAGSLPEDTVVALGLGDAGAMVRSTWDRLRDGLSAVGAAERFDAEVTSLGQTYGITLPDDLVAAVGTQLTLAVGQGSTPQVAARLSGSTTSIEKLISAVERASGVPLGLATVQDGEVTVIGSDDAYARAVAEGDALGAAGRFRDAVPDRDHAQAVLFIDIDGLVTAYGDELGLDPDAREQIAPLSALGVSVHSDRDVLDYRLRLATR